MAPSHRFRIVGFDLDGTLLDTVPDIAAAVDRALVDEGRATLGADRIRAMVGGGVRHLLAQAMAATGGGDEATLDRLQARQLDCYRAAIAVDTRPFPGVIAALDALRDQGVRLGIVTNKVEHLTRLLLDRLGLADRFAAVLGGDTLPGRGKPAPDAILAMVDALGGGPAAFVGDSRYDVVAAHAAGLPVVTCRHGYRDEPVEAIGADAIVDDFGDLLPTLARL